MKKITHLSCLLFLIPAFLLSSIGYAQDPGYHVIRQIHLGGGGGWDYINVFHPLHRVYVSHGTEVIVMDERSGDSIGVIPHTIGVHGIVFAPEFNKGFVTDGQLNQVTVFNLKTNQVIDSVGTGKGPDGILYDPFTKKVFVNCGQSQVATIIDASTDHVYKTLPLGGRPETAVSDGQGHIYVNIESKSELAAINTRNFTITNDWPIGKGQSPSGLAIDSKHHVLFIGCDNKMMVVMNAKTGAVLAELPTGQGCDGTDFDPGTGYAFSSNGEGTLTMIKDVAGKYKVVANVPTKRGARTSTVDVVNHHLFLPTAEFGPETAQTPNQRFHRPPIIPGTFEVLEVGK
ncbi:MAG TPA: YncE family protein [Chitinophagaceae bacterium]|nr:YncE family protein [Chitinophagaceae bacterium]